MTSAEFLKVMQAQFSYCEDLMGTKAKEYTPADPADNELIEDADGQLVFGFACDDRLRHFKKAAVLMNTTPKAALFGMLSKHLISVADMCMDDQDYTKERWTEKITDSINYLVLLRALIEEGQNE